MVNRVEKGDGIGFIGKEIILEKKEFIDGFGKVIEKHEYFGKSKLGLRTDWNDLFRIVVNRVEKSDGIGFMGKEFILEEKEFIDGFGKVIENHENI